MNQLKKKRTNESSVMRASPRPQKMTTPAKASSAGPITHAELNQNDVLLGRGTGFNEFEGNRRFRTIVEERKDDYSSKKDAAAKKQVAVEILDKIRSSNGRFLKLAATVKQTASVVEDGTFVQVSEKAAIEKIKRALREPKQVHPQPLSDALMNTVDESNKTEEKRHIDDNLTFDPLAVSSVLWGQIDGQNTVPLEQGSAFGASGGSLLSSSFASLLPTPMVASSLPLAIDADSPLFGMQPSSIPDCAVSREASLEIDDGKMPPAAEANENDQPSAFEESDNVAEFLLASLAVSHKPRVSQQQVFMEQASLTDDERAAMLADVFGQMCDVNPMRKKPKRDLDPASIDFLVKQMRLELERIPHDEKRAMIQAQAKCSDPAEFGDSRLLQFLRCEGMNVKLAARRLALYWNCRKDTFGDEKYLMRMTLGEALRDDTVAIETGVYCVLPHPDASGRAMLFSEPARHSREGYTSESLLRAAWYAAEVVARNNQDIGGGVVRVMFAKNFTLFDYDNVFDSVVRYESSCWPIRMNTIHACCPTSILSRTILPIITAMKSKSARARTLVHDVPEEDIVQVLENYGITKRMLPSAMGGDVQLNHRDWVARRRSVEMSMEEL